MPDIAISYSAFKSAEAGYAFKEGKEILQRA